MNWLSVNSPKSITLLDTVTQAVENAGSDNLEVFGGTFQGGYWIQQQPRELARLVCLLASLGPFKSSLEIGIAAGGTTRFIRDLVQVDRTLIIDDGQHTQFKYWEENRAHMSSLDTADCFIGDSHSIHARIFLSARDHKFDLVGIDGDHSAAGIRADLELVRGFLADGAVVWFHDIIAVPEIAAFWAELRTSQQVLLETDGLGIGVIRFTRGECG